MARIFGAAKLARGPRTAFGVLRTVAEEMEDPLEVYARIVSSKKGLYADEPKNPDLDLSSPKAAKKQFDKLDLTAFLNSSRTFAEAHNLVVDCFSLNGRIRPLSALQSDMLHMLGDEQQYISNLVARGQITDRTKSIYGKTLLGEGKENVAQRYSTNTARLLIDQENAPNVAYEDLRVDEWEHVDVGTVSVIAVCDEKTKRGAGLARLVRGLVEDENVARVAVVESASGSNYALFNGRRVDSPKGSEPLDLDEVRKVVVGHEAEIAEVILEDSLADYSGDEDKLDVLQRVRCLAGERSKKPRVAARSAISTLSVDPFTVLASKEREASVVAVVDPLTEGAQRAASVLLALKELVSVSLVLTPTPDLHELPLQKYYRFAVEFSAPDYAGESIGCEFSSLPSKQVLTLRVDTPEAWDVQTAVATQDLDNIQLTSEDLVIEYQLKSLVVAGQCYDLRDRRPPNGLQVELAPLGADTLVMQNLGYFQLRGQPGVFDIKLKPGSRSSQLYDVLAPPEYKDSAVGVPVVVADLDGGATQLRVRKKKGFEDAELLLSSTDGEEEQVVSAEVSVEPNSLLKRMFANKGGNNNKEEEEQQETVHVFSLATGSLYERFLKIMMLSVRKRTTGPVKFWLFENYLSPSFKQDAEALASGRGFEVSYVTYKWPEWLRRQTVKQRIIWGYKILFLDVLFPLGVPKIIYVDADQVVRGDLRELWNLDLKGRPYGYTPFCDSRPETLGFQFWRSGYWADHLRGKPYHISALYVVDLVKFRQMAVGDQLRAVYDQLSRDPNSLSNLDQDLPNYAQHSIPIFSLPQEWLWCESWCDDDSKGESKTIDLCNNPLHKENKLMMAKRVINGSLFQESWDDLDQEVKAICGGEARVL